MELRQGEEMASGLWISPHQADRGRLTDHIATRDERNAEKPRP